MSRKIFRTFFVLILIIASVVVTAPRPVRAAGPWYVTTTGDDNNDCVSPATPCATINGAIGKASNGDTINIATGIYTGSGGEVVLIDKDITLSGGWDASFTTQSDLAIIDGESSRRGLNVNPGVTTTVEQILVENGNGGEGGGIYNAGTLELNNSIIVNNRAGTAGGGLFNTAVLIINNSTINLNLADGGNGGGITNSGGTVTLNNSTVSGNSAGYGGNAGGGIANSDGTVTLNNSTISGNAATTGSGGGIYWNGGTVILKNTILANNSAASFAPDCVGAIGSAGYNLVGDTSSCGFTPSTGDLIDTAPLLGPLQDNGGPTPTHALLALSLAIDAGDPNGCTDQDGNPLTTDQRGVTRPRGTRCDIGAYEYADVTNGSAASLAILSGSGQRVGINSAFPQPLRVVALDDQGNRVSGVAVTFTAPGSGPSGTFADTGTNTTSAVTDEGGAATASVFTANNQAGTYAISASATGLEAVTFNLEQFVPNKDKFSEAQAIDSLPFSQSIDITEATAEPGEPQVCYLMDRTVWYSFTPTETMVIHADTQGSAISGNANIYRAAGSAIADLQFLNCSGPSSSATFTAEAGQKYYFQVGAAFGEIGTVQFNVAEVASITGRVTDAVTNAPLPGNTTPFAQATLQRVCGPGCLEVVSSQNADSEGRFLFDNYFGGPLPTGTYQIEVFANLYQTEQFGPFEFSGISLNVGDLPIDPLPTIGSISGRLFDAATGKPVPTTFTPSVQLYRCTNGDCSEFVNIQTPDNQGGFRFESDFSGSPLPVGTYQLHATADQYQHIQGDPFEVGAGVHKIMGNLRIISFPVRFSDIQPCAQIPAAGGECAFSVKVWNGLATRLRGDTWSVVNSVLPDSFAGVTDFQAKELQGLDLDKGKSKVFRFRFTVPANGGPFGSSICTRMFVGQGSNPLFNTIGFRELFCVFRNAQGFSIASPQEARTLTREIIPAASTGTEIEPNNSCQAAQDIGSVSLPFILDGNLDSSQTPDVDFFRLAGTPGAMATIDLEGQSTGKGTLGDPFLGFFDSNCNLIDLNDDSGSTNSRLEITIPADGIFILAATTCCDSGFTGGGNGSYQLTVAPVQVIGSISGRVTDAMTGKPLRGDLAPFATVRLLQCGNFGCFDVNSQATDSQGRFRFENDSNGAPLRVSDYLVVASAIQYMPGQTEQFAVGEGENHDVGGIAIASFPVRFSDGQPCSIPAAGGVCEFSIKITNGDSTRLSGKAWSMVSGSSIGSFTDFTAFQTDAPQDVKLNPGKSTTLRFRFRVPGSVANGANICLSVYVGENPNAFFDTKGLSLLFCFTKGSTGFTLMSPQEAQSASQQMQRIIPPNLFIEKKK